MPDPTANHPAAIDCTDARTAATTMSAVRASRVTRATSPGTSRTRRRFSSRAAPMAGRQPTPRPGPLGEHRRSVERLSLSRELYAYTVDGADAREPPPRPRFTAGPDRHRIAAFPIAMRDVLEVGWPAEGIGIRRAALGHAVAFETWVRWPARARRCPGARLMVGSSETRRNGLRLARDFSWGAELHADELAAKITEKAPSPGG